MYTLTQRLLRVVDRFRAPGRGGDVFDDLAQAMPFWRPACIFDVGASEGQSAVRFSRRFPLARIHCFEPVPEAFTRLEIAMRGRRGVTALPVALGAAPGVGEIRRGPSFLTASVVPLDDSTPEDPSALQVQIYAIDDLCAAQGIDHIGYLKVDAEGGDFAVLQGAEGMIREHRIDLIEVEAGMSRLNQWHVPFEILKAHLEGRGYHLFGLYEQTHEWPTREPHLRRASCVFVSETAIAAHRLLTARPMSRHVSLAPAHPGGPTLR